MNRISIELFSDVLCIWAYGAQVRIDQLGKDYRQQITLQHRFLPIFAAAHSRIEDTWKDRDGYLGFNRHLQQVAARWDHVPVHPGIWLQEAPHSSTVAHLYLKSVQLCIEQGRVGNALSEDANERPLFEEFLWQVRCAFFQEARDISDFACLDALADNLGLPLGEIHKLLANGTAHAALHLDTEARDRYLVPGSPTLVFNEGRQRLYGNIGYRIIEANIRELLQEPQYGEASWC